MSFSATTQVVRFTVPGFKVDELVKSRKTSFFVIPAKAGIQFFQLDTESLDSGLSALSSRSKGFTGVTTFYETIKVKLMKERPLKNALNFYNFNFSASSVPRAKRVREYPIRFVLVFS